MASLFRVSYDAICCYLCNLGKDEQSNQNRDSNAPITVSEKLTDPKSVEMNEANSAKSPPPPPENDEQENAMSPKSQDQNFETDSIVVFQNNEYHTNVKERAYYLTYNSDPVHRNRVPIRIVVLIVCVYICLGGLLFSIWESDSKEEQQGSDFFKWVSCNHVVDYIIKNFVILITSLSRALGILLFHHSINNWIRRYCTR